MDVGSADRRAGPVVIVAPHRTIRHALRLALETLGVDVAADVALGREAVLAAIQANARVALVDAATNPSAGIDTCRELRAGAPMLKLVSIVPRAGATSEVMRAVGVNGVVTTDATMADVVTVLSASARDVRRTRRRTSPSVVLTTREREVLGLAASGMTDGQISRALMISHKTVKNHLHHVYGKLGAHGRTDAVTIAVRQGLIVL